MRLQMLVLLLAYHSNLLSAISVQTPDHECTELMRSLSEIWGSLSTMCHPSAHTCSLRSMCATGNLQSIMQCLSHSPEQGDRRPELCICAGHGRGDAPVFQV